MVFGYMKSINKMSLQFCGDACMDKCFLSKCEDSLIRTAESVSQHGLVVHESITPVIGIGEEQQFRGLTCQRAPGLVAAPVS